MLDNTLVKDFQIRLGSKFLFPEVVEEFKDYFEAENGGVYRSLVDYINTTIVETSVLGWTSPPTSEQSKLGNNRVYNSSLHPNRKRNKKLSLIFSLKKSFLNYMVLYRNLEWFDDGDKKDRNDDDSIFFDSIFLDLLDSKGNIVYTWVYREIVVENLSEVRLAKNDKGIGNRQFTLDVSYNEVDFNSHLNKNKSDLDPSYKHDFS